MPFLNLLSFDAWDEVVVVFSTAFYLLQCYAGYKGIRWLVAVVGFIVGFLTGFLLSLSLYQDRYIPALIGLAVGAGIAFLAFKLYLVGIFIFSGTMAYSVVSMIPLDESGSTGIVKSVICIAAFVVVGILSVKFAKTCVILVTSITGAINAVNQMRAPIAVLENNILVRVVAIILLAVTGILVQKATTRKN